MHSKITRVLLSGSAAAALLLTASTAAGAYGGSSYGGSSYGGSSYGGSSYGGDAPGKASSYINPDAGTLTANPDVDSNSSCFSPDQYDRQKFSDAGTANRNVHNDACFLLNGLKVDGPASFQSKGVGFISACPDPDKITDTNNGSRFSVLSDTNGDGRNDRCFQSGYQMKGIAGDMEFHARMNNNTGTAGTQYVTWCSDANQNGCDDESNKSTIRIDWSADGTATYSTTSWSSSYSR